MKSKGFIVALLIVGIVLIFASAYVVDETEQVVVTQFGKVIGEPKKTPGLTYSVGTAIPVKSPPWIKHLSGWIRLPAGRSWIR